MPYKNSTKSQLSDQPFRILHVVGGMDRGGAETWLMHVLRHIDRTQFQMDFLVPDDRHYAYTDELQSFGCKILPCIEPAQPRLYATNFKRIIQENAPYDAIHVHVHHFSGYVLYLAKQAGIKARIIHSHIDTSVLEAQSNWKRKLYTTSMEWLINRKSTAGLATSRRAAADLLGSNWPQDPRWRTLYCGIDLTPFEESIDPLAVRQELGIPAEAIVVGHVGRFEPQKNHDFLLEIAAEMAKCEPKMRLLLMGSGSLLPAMQAKVAQLGLDKVVIFGGVRSDIPRLMKGVMDVFLFPSLYEGLGLVLVEAQAAGLPCVLADIVPEEADVVEPLVQRISLAKSAAEWAETVLKHRHSKQLVNQTDALKQVIQSYFNITVSVDELTGFYAGLGKT